MNKYVRRKRCAASRRQRQTPTVVVSVYGWSVGLVVVVVALNDLRRGGESEKEWFEKSKEEEGKRKWQWNRRRTALLLLLMLCRCSVLTEVVSGGDAVFSQWLAKWRRCKQTERLKEAKLEKHRTEQQNKKQKTKHKGKTNTGYSLQHSLWITFDWLKHGKE